MGGRLVLFTVTMCGMTGCKTVKDLISWTPLWWINSRPVQDGGTLRLNPGEFAVRNHVDGGRVYRYTLRGGKIYHMKEGTGNSARWNPLPRGNPRGCDGKTLRVIRMSVDNNRVFAMTIDAEGRRGLWWCGMKADQAGWAEMLIQSAGDWIKPGYSSWIGCAHKIDGSWVNLLAFRQFSPYIEPRFRRVNDGRGGTSLKVEAYNAPRASIDVSDIVDIAVGHWTGTVVTYYALMGSTGKIMYIDEEIVMDRWKEVPNTHWRSNDPYPLDSTSLIAASNSVVCAYYRKGTSAYVTWIRWDFHNPQDFGYFPLDWCEKRWHTVPCPVMDARSLTIDTHWPDSVRDSLWNIPKSIGSLDWKGFLGSVPRHLISAYRVRLEVSGAAETARIEIEPTDYEAEKRIASSDWAVTRKKR